YDYDSKFGNNNVSPRLGVTFRAGQQTLLRASWGLFYDRYRLGVLQAVPEFGGFNGQNALEYDFPRLAADALFPLPRSIAALAQAAGDPNFLNKQFGIPAGALVTASNVKSLTGRTPAKFAADVNT